MKVDRERLGRLKEALQHQIALIQHYQYWASERGERQILRLEADIANLQHRLDRALQDREAAEQKIPELKKGLRRIEQEIITEKLRPKIEKARELAASLEKLECDTLPQLLDEPSQASSSPQPPSS